MVAPSKLGQLRTGQAPASTAARSAAVLPALVPRPVPAFAAVLPVLRTVHGQRQMSLDLRPR